MIPQLINPSVVPMQSLIQGTLRGNPLEYNRFYGNIGQAQQTPLAKLRTYYYHVQQLAFPLTPTEFDAKFTSAIPLFVQDVAPCPGTQTNATFAAGTNEPFCVLAVGVVAIGKGFAFAMPGRMVVKDAATECVPVVEGCASGTGRDAVLDYGGTGWRFIEAFFNAYRLQMAVWRRYLVLDEALFDIGMVPDAPEHCGTGHALISAMPYIREVNNVLADKLCNRRFLPQNHAGTECIGAPTAEVIYGHTCIRGVGNSIFCLNQPICYLPGMRFDVAFQRVENDCCFLPEMRRSSVLDCATPTLPDAGYNDTFCSSSGFPSVYTVPGGCVSIGVVLSGYALTPAACLDYLLNLVPGSIQYQMVSGHAYVGDLMRRSQQDDQLRAMLAGAPDEKRNKLQGLISGPPPG